jgi:hypothetical protein
LASLAATIDLEFEVALTTLLGTENEANDPTTDEKDDA